MEDGDRSNLQPSTSSHRLPTISATQALGKLSQSGGNSVTTGLKSLDQGLRGPSRIPFASQLQSAGGFVKGQITEIYGPPAAGKTALALQATAEALLHGSHVVWIDASKPLYGPRLAMHLPQSASHETLLETFYHYATPTLSHLLSLICHPPTLFPPANTTLLILDGVSSLFTSAYPEKPLDNTSSRKRSDDATWIANRRYAVMAEFLSKLTKLAVVRDLAVVLVSQTSLKVRTELGAVLRPAIWTKSWSEGIQNRIVVFRDFFFGKDGARKRNFRFVAVVRFNGVSRTRIESAVPFRIESDGCRELESATSKTTAEFVPFPRKSPQKRKRKRTEVADSQSEDSEEDLLKAPDHENDDYKDQTAQLQASYTRPGEEDSDLADFEAAMEAGFDDV